MASADDLFEAYRSTTDPDLFQVWSVYSVQSKDGFTLTRITCCEQFALLFASTIWINAHSY